MSRMASLDDSREMDSANDIFATDETFVLFASVIFEWRPARSVAAASASSLHWMSGHKRRAKPTPS
jgi:hypothetical protein